MPCNFLHAFTSKVVIQILQRNLTFAEGKSFIATHKKKTQEKEILAHTNLVSEIKRVHYLNKSFRLGSSWYHLELNTSVACLCFRKVQKDPMIKQEFPECHLQSNFNCCRSIVRKKCSRSPSCISNKVGWVLLLLRQSTTAIRLLPMPHSILM